MKKYSKEDIVNAFSEKQKKTLKLPDLDVIDWDSLDFLGWIHPSGHKGYVVYKEGALKGIEFEITRSETNKVKMCNWCKTVREGRDISVFSVSHSKNRSIGTYLCWDLQCSLYVRELKKVPPIQMRETISKEDKIKRLVDNFKKFVLELKL